MPSEANPCGDPITSRPLTATGRRLACAKVASSDEHEPKPFAVWSMGIASPRGGAFEKDRTPVPERDRFEDRQGKIPHGSGRKIEPAEHPSAGRGPAKAPPPVGRSGHILVRLYPVRTAGPSPDRRSRRRCDGPRLTGRTVAGRTDCATEPADPRRLSARVPAPGSCPHSVAAGSAPMGRVASACVFLHRIRP